MDGGTSPSPRTTDGRMYIDERLGGVRYGIGLSFGILSVLATIAVASYICTRDANQTRRTSTSGISTDTNAASSRPNDVEMGLDEETIKSYPKILYPHLKTVKPLNDSIHCSTSTAASACSICLSDYNDSDFIRVLPDCKHLFHLNCVDPWLRLHPTCPICRMSLFPLPDTEPS